MINKDQVVTDLNIDAYWESNITYTTDEFIYNIGFDIHVLAGTFTLLPYITIRVRGEFRRRSKRIYRFTKETKKLIPYKHRDIIYELLEMFEADIVVTTLLTFQYIEYDNPFIYLEKQNVNWF